MNTQTETRFRSNDIECDNCARIITEALSVLSGVARVAVDVEQKTVHVFSDAENPSPDDLQAAMETAGFDAERLG